MRSDIPVNEFPDYVIDMTVENQHDTSIVAAILVLIASVAAVGVSVVSLVFNKFGPEFSAVEAEDVTPAIFVGVAVLVCTVFDFVAFLAAVGVMITPAVLLHYQ